jgi:uracil-DNA glycosylase
VLVLVGRLAMDRFLGAQPLDALVGREHAVEHAGGHSIAIPLPHPSGASSWIHAPEHRELLHRSLDLIGTRLVGATPRQSVA